MSIHHNNTGLSFLYVLFLTTVGFQDSSFASVDKFKQDNLKTEREELISLKSTFLKSNYPSTKARKNAVVQVNQVTVENEDKKIHLASRVKQRNLNYVEVNSVTIDNQIADADLDTNTDNSSQEDEIGVDTSITLGWVRKVSLFFFLLFFIPLGLFYPLFLLYRKLLDFNIDGDTKPSEEEVFDNFLPTSSSLEDTELNLYSDQATVSILQVAFLPKIINLKQQLEQASLNTNQKSKSKALDLMRSSIPIFITQQDWTHASFESFSYASQEAEEKFDTVLSIESDKCIDRKLSSVNVGHHQNTNIYVGQDTFKYTVVTMVFHTAGNNTLMEEIGTKEDLAKLLINLSQINGDDLIDFALIWNPLQENEFITNDQLLRYYKGMERLF